MSDKKADEDSRRRGFYDSEDELFQERAQSNLRQSIHNTRFEKEEKKPEAPKPPCQHPHLRFEAGSLYLVCDDCKDVYVSVGKCPGRIIQNINARGLPLDGRVRSDPDSGPARVR